MNKWDADDFQAGKIILYTIMVNTFHHKFVHSIGRTYNTKGESNAIYEFLMVIMYHCITVGSSIIKNTLFRWGRGMLTMGKALGWESETVWKISVFSAQFCHESKTALKVYLRNNFRCFKNEDDLILGICSHFNKYWPLRT